jgi:hypothetical protein
MTSLQLSTHRNLWKYSNAEHTQKNGEVLKVDKKFLTLHGHNIHCQQRELSKLLMLIAGLVSKMASQQEKAFCVLHLRCPDL